MTNRKKDNWIVKNWLPIVTITVLIVPFLAMFVVLILLKKNIFNNPEFWYGYMGYVGTVILSSLALWQNKRYKKLSEDMANLIYMPDFFNASTVREALEATKRGAYNSLTISPTDDKSCKPVESPLFLLINQPIIFLKPLSLRTNGRNVISDFKESSMNVLSTEFAFSLIINLPEEFYKESNKYKLEMTFQNIYGKSYSKEMDFIINEGCGRAVNWSCSRAKCKEE